MQRINLNIGRIVVQDRDLPPDRARLLQEEVRSELDQLLKRAELAPVHGRNTTRVVSQSAAVQLPDGGDGPSELAGQLARAILNTLNVTGGT